MFRTPSGALIDRINDMLRIIIVLLVAFSGLVQAQAAARLVTRAARAMGGTGALDSLANKTVEINAANFALGQEETPLSPAGATLVTGRGVFDYAGTRVTTSQEQRLVTGAVNRIRRVTTMAMSMTETNGVLAMDVASVAANVERNLSLEIDRIIVAAVHHPAAATLLTPKMLRGEVADGIRMALGPETIDVWFDRINGLPVATERVGDDDITGDRRTITWYTRWLDAGGIKLPRQIDVEVSGRLLSHTVVTAAALNQRLDANLFTIPDSMRAKAPPATPVAPIAVMLVAISPGVWRAEGGSHHSLVVEQDSGLIVVEGPHSTARGNAVLDTLRSRFSSKRILGVVMTHHHHDHAGGIRAFMARGIPVITHQRNVAFTRNIATAQKTVVPDRLSRGAPIPRITAVRDSLVLGSGAGRVVLYELPTTHAEGVLAAWVPSAGTVFTSDVVSLTANQPAARLGSVEMSSFARARGIMPTRFAGGHGIVGDWSLIEAAARE
jgi:glyoxylase-like metal-dependent hydrolase (beta-lactamase superfamily II)